MTKKDVPKRDGTRERPYEKETDLKRYIKSRIKLKLEGIL